MSDIDIELLQKKLNDSRAKYESRKAELKKQGINLSVPELDVHRELAQLRNEYINLENELWKYKLENQKKVKKTVEKIAKQVDKLHNTEVNSSGINESETIYVFEQQVINENLEIEVENIYILEEQTIHEDIKTEFEQISDKLWDALLRKVLINMGVFIWKDFINSSKEGKMGAVALGSAATVASLANDGNIDSLEALGIMGAAWIGKQIGEVFTSAESFYKEGINFADKNQYSEAIINFTKAINKNKKYIEAYFERGKSYLNIGDFAKANNDFGQTISLCPSHIEAYKKRAVACYALKNYQGAISDNTFVLELHPNDSESYFRRGMAHLGSKLYTRAIDDFSTVVKLNPKHSLSYLIRGNVYLSMRKKPGEAIRDFNHAIRIDPSLDEAYLGLATAYSQLKHYNAAIEEYSRAILSNIKDIRVNAYAGRCFSHLALNNKWKARYDAYMAGLKVKQLAFNRTETLAFTAIPVILLAMIMFFRSISQNSYKTSGSIQPANVVSIIKYL